MVDDLRAPSRAERCSPEPRRQPTTLRMTGVDHGTSTHLKHAWRPPGQPHRVDHTPWIAAGRSDQSSFRDGLLTLSRRPDRARMDGWSALRRLPAVFFVGTGVEPPYAPAVRWVLVVGSSRCGLAGASESPRRGLLRHGHVRTAQHRQSCGCHRWGAPEGGGGDVAYPCSPLWSVVLAASSKVGCRHRRWGGDGAPGAGVSQIGTQRRRSYWHCLRMRIACRAWTCGCSIRSLRCPSALAAMR